MLIVGAVNSAFGQGGDFIVPKNDKQVTFDFRNKTKEELQKIIDAGSYELGNDYVIVFHKKSSASRSIEAMHSGVKNYSYFKFYNGTSFTITCKSGKTISLVRVYGMGHYTKMTANPGVMKEDDPWGVNYSVDWVSSSDVDETNADQIPGFTSMDISMGVYANQMNEIVGLSFITHDNVSYPRVWRVQDALKAEWEADSVRLRYDDTNVWSKPSSEAPTIWTLPRSSGKGYMGLTLTMFGGLQWQYGENSFSLNSDYKNKYLRTDKEVTLFLPAVPDNYRIGIKGKNADGKALEIKSDLNKWYTSDYESPYKKAKNSEDGLDLDVKNLWIFDKKDVAGNPYPIDGDGSFGTSKATEPYFFTPVGSKTGVQDVYMSPLPKLPL